MDEERYDRKELFSRGWGWLKRAAAETLERKLDLVPRSCLRPPGALVEALFLATCEGSGRCAAACPFGAIRIEGGPGAHAERTPILIPSRVPCHMCDGAPCSLVCPSGALAPVGRDLIRIGLAEIDRIGCRAWMGGECRLCLDACPLGERALRWSADGGPVVIPDRCSGCGSCTFACPVRPRAIRIRPR